MNGQLSIDFAAARAAADRGMRQAAEHAERIDDAWPQTAFDFIGEYAATHAEFTVEEVTAAASLAGKASPTDDRAWGSIVRRAAIAGLILNTHRTRPRVKGHGAPGPVWASLVFGGGV